MTGDVQAELREQVLDAGARGAPLSVRGGGSKAFYGREAPGAPLHVAGHAGITDYQPTELVLTARAGTRIADINAELGSNGQVLGFDPPLFDPATTLGGAVAAGLAGPSRPFAGSVSDFLLGAKILSGRGEVLQFGGRVIKNVAGFDVTRLMAGSLGCLGVLLEVSVKVLPRHEREVTLAFAHNALEESIGWMNEQAGRPLPITAAGWLDGVTRVRLSGSDHGVAAARAEMGGDEEADSDYWARVRDQRHPFFHGERLLMRAVTPGAAAGFGVQRDQLVDWAGSCRWLRADEWDEAFDAGARTAGGHCALFRHGDRTGAVFPPPHPVAMSLHRKLKSAFDPSGILNPGRMYRDL